MKKIIILAMALLAVAGTAHAQKAEKQITTTVFITDIDYEGCVKKIYDNFFGKGVKSIKCDVPTKSVAVTYDAAKNTPEGLMPAFKYLKVKVYEHMTVEQFEEYKKKNPSTTTQGHGHGHKH